MVYCWYRMHECLDRTLIIGKVDYCGVGVDYTTVLDEQCFTG